MTKHTNYSFFILLLLLVLIGCSNKVEDKLPSSKNDMIVSVKKDGDEVEGLIKSTELSSKKLTKSAFEGTVTIDKNLNKKLQGNKFEFQLSMNNVNGEIKIKDDAIYTMNAVDETETFHIKLNIKDKKMLTYIKNKSEDLDYLRLALTFVDKDKKPIFIRSFMFPKSEIIISE